MKTTILIILLTLGNARKEGIKRWGAGNFVLKVDQTKPTHVYELYVTTIENRKALMGIDPCKPITRPFFGKSWAQVFDMSLGVKSHPECVKK